MQAGTHVLAVIFLVASACSACFWTRLLPLPRGKSLRLLAGLVLWQVIQIVPVQLLAALQIGGYISRVSIPKLAALQVGVLAGTVGRLWMRKSPSSSSSQVEARPVTGLPTYILICSAVLAISYFLFALSGLSSFPSGSDDLTYHLPLASRWLQDGSLNLPASGAWRFSLPGNTEILMMVLLAFGKQSAVFLPNCVAALMLGLASYALAMAFSKGNRAASVTVCLIVLSIPMVEFQTFSAYVDLMGTAAIFAAFALLLIARGSQQKENGNDAVVLVPAILLLSALACGISLGTKPIFCFYAWMWVAFLCVIVWEKRGLGAKALLKPILAVGVGLILPSGFWFARAAVRTGNPVYPLQVRVGHHVLFHGVESSQITPANYEDNFVHRRREWLIYPWTEWKRDPGYLMVPYSEGSGVGAAFAAIVPVGLAFLLFRLLFRKPVDRADCIGIGFLGLGGLAWWELMLRMPRFGLPIVVFACILSAPLVASLQGHKRRAFGILLVSSVSATLMVSSFVPFHTLAGRMRTRQWSRAQIYAYPQVIDTLPRGSRVLNASGISEKNFPLEGAALTNNVITDFEAPSELTPDSLRATGADVIAEIVPGGKYSEVCLRSLGARVIADEVVPAGEERLHWIVWRVEKVRAKDRP